MDIGKIAQSGNMADSAESFKILLFGDETGDFREPLQRLCERQRGVGFLHFIDRLVETLRDELRQQPRHVQKQIPPFSDILELVKQYKDLTSQNQILETTLTCICQLGSVIRCVFRLSSLGTRNNTCIASSMIIHPNILCPRKPYLLACAQGC